MDVSFLPEDAYLHVLQVILLGLAVVGVVPLHLEFLSLEEVTGVIFVADGKRYDVQVLESLYDGSVGLSNMREKLTCKPAIRRSSSTIFISTTFLPVPG